MKIHKKIPSRKDELDTTYQCELTGWQLAAIFFLYYKCAGGDPNTTLRGELDKMGVEIAKTFPFLFDMDFNFIFEPEDSKFLEGAKNHILTEE